MTQRPLPAQGSLRHSLSSEQRKEGREVRGTFLWAPVINLPILGAGLEMVLWVGEGMREERRLWR